MLSWLLFYTGILDLERLPQMEIADPVGLVQSQALINGNQSLRVVLNGSSATRTLSARFIHEFFGSGVQHVAFSCRDIFAAVADMRARGADFLKIPDNYYDDIEAKYGLDAATMAALRDNQILYDREGEGEFFQVYTHAFDERFFFEIVERRDYHGFGAANAAIRLAAQTRESRPLTMPEGLTGRNAQQENQKGSETMSIMTRKAIRAALLLAACCHLTPALADPLPCDDGIKTAFRPDADTSVIAVRLVKKGEELKALDASAADHGGGRPLPREAAGRPRRHGGKGQERALLVRRHRHRGLAADAGQLERAHPQLWRRRLGRRRSSLCRQDRQQGAGDRQRQYRLRVGHDGCGPALVSGRLVRVSVRRQGQRGIAARFLGASDGGAGRQDQGAGQPLLRQGAEICLLRRPFAGRPAGHEARAGIPRTLRRLHDRAAGAEHREIRNGGALSPDRDEDRTRLHLGEQGGGCGLRRQSRRRQQARGCRLRQAGAWFPARSLCLRLQSRARRRRRCARA